MQTGTFFISPASPVFCSALVFPALQVSGIRLSFDPSLPPGRRVLPGSVTVGDAPLQPGGCTLGAPWLKALKGCRGLQVAAGWGPATEHAQQPAAVNEGLPLCADKTYSLATKAYLAQGRDGEGGWQLRLQVVPLLRCRCAADVWQWRGTCKRHCPLCMPLRMLACICNLPASLPHAPAGYEALQGAKLLQDCDSTPLLPTVIANHFLLLRTVNRAVGAIPATCSRGIEGAASAGSSCCALLLRLLLHPASLPCMPASLILLPLAAPAAKGVNRFPLSAAAAPAHRRRPRDGGQPGSGRRSCC